MECKNNDVRRTDVVPPLVFIHLGRRVIDMIVGVGVDTFRLIDKFTP